MKPLEEIFRAKVFNMLKDEGKINDDLIDKLMKWRHSGFSIHNGVRIKRDDEEGRESLSQYILRNYAEFRTMPSRSVSAAYIAIFRLANSA